MYPAVLNQRYSFRTGKFTQHLGMKLFHNLSPNTVKERFCYEDAPGTGSRRHGRLIYTLYPEYRMERIQSWVSWRAGRCRRPLATGSGTQTPAPRCRQRRGLLGVVMLLAPPGRASGGSMPTSLLFQAPWPSRCPALLLLNYRWPRKQHPSSCRPQRVAG